MEGDEFTWHEIADRLKKTVSEVKEGMPWTEALRWLKYIEEKDWHRRTKEDWYHAQISYFLYLLMFMLGGTPTKTMEDFFIKFKTGKDEKKEPEQPKLYEEERAEMLKRAEESKSVWLAVAEMGKKGKLLTRKPPSKPKPQPPNPHTKGAF